eukprot:363941-Chlamydomonas_euryale.AAC.19
MSAALTEALAKLSTNDVSSDAVALVKKNGISCMTAATEALAKATTSSDVTEKENALKAVKAFVAEFGKAAEPYLVSLIPNLLDRAADKAAPVREAAVEAAKAIFGVLNPYSTAIVLGYLFTGMEQAKNWQTKVLALESLAGMAKTAPNQIAAALSDIVPQLTGKCAHRERWLLAWPVFMFACGCTLPCVCAHT